jgi:hypothetical protein
MILSEIIGITPINDVTVSPVVVIKCIERSMEPYILRMERMGLDKNDFLDLILTLRRLALYAKNTGGYIRFQTIPNH